MMRLMGHWVKEEIGEGNNDIETIIIWRKTYS